MTNLHHELTLADLHTPYRTVWADSTARLADATAYDPEESIAGGGSRIATGLQLDTAQIYILSNHNPVTWIPNASVAGGPFIAADGSVDFTGSQSMANNDLLNGRVFGFNNLGALGNLGASPTINWTLGAVQEGTLDQAVTTVAFTAPPGKARLQLLLTNGPGGNLTVTWPGTVKWTGGSPPNIGNTAGDELLVTLFYYPTGTLYRAAAIPFDP